MEPASWSSSVYEDIMNEIFQMEALLAAEGVAVGESFDGQQHNPESKRAPLRTGNDKETDDIFKLYSENNHLCLNDNQKLQQSIAKCVARLTALEEEIVIKEDSLEARLEKCSELEAEGKKKDKYYTSINLFATPYFRDTRKSIPSPNEDSIFKRMIHDVDAYTAPPRPWIAPEHTALRDAVLKNALQVELRPLLVSKDYYKDKLHNHIIADDEASEITEKLENLEKAIENVRQKPTEELLATEKQLDWMRISTLMRVGDRNAEECERMWYNYLHPSINKKKWTAAEDRELIKQVRRFGGKNWDRIAKELKLSKRTAIQCLEHYQSELNQGMLKSIWTPKDDKKLMEAVEQCRIGNYIPWNKVSYYIDGWTREQVLTRWTRYTAPSLRRGPWAEEEDAVLLAAAERYGYKWTKIQDLLPGRSGFSCRERYIKVLVRRVVVGDWTPEEDRRLFKLIQKYPDGKWTEIANNFPSRTDNMCLQRASQLKKHHPELFMEHISQYISDLDILEVLTPTRNSTVLNKYREEINKYREVVRATAEEGMIRTMMKLKNFKTTEEAKEALNTSKISFTFLMELSAHLLADESKRTYHRKQSRIQRPIRTPSGEIMDVSSDSDDDDLPFSIVAEEEEDGCGNDAVNSLPHIKTDEELAVETELDVLFTPVALHEHQPVVKGRSICKSRKRFLECKMVTSVLYKTLNCVEDQLSSDCDDTVHLDNDFAVSVPYVCQNFVVPDSNEIPLFPPNRSTLEAFKYLLINRQCLASSFYENPPQDTHILSLISSSEENRLFCTSCYQKGNCQSRPDVVVNMPSMAESEDDSQLRNEQIEYSSSTTPCSECERLNRFRKEYHLLRRRLFSLFLWPALLTEMSPTTKQKHSILEQEASLLESYRVERSSWWMFQHYQFLIVMAENQCSRE